MHLLVVFLEQQFWETMALLLALLLVRQEGFLFIWLIQFYFSGAWLGFRAVNPYHSLVSQLSELNDHQKQNLTDEIRRTVGSSSAEQLLRYVSQ